MTKLVLALLFLLAGCRAGPEPVAEAGGVDPVPLVPQVAGVRHALANQFWASTDDGSPPGSALVFLEDGTLLLHSCWEVYRLARWEMVSDSALRWDEDGREIRGDVIAVAGRDLVLRLHLTSGSEEQRFRRAEVPFVCPELPR